MARAGNTTFQNIGGRWFKSSLLPPSSLALCGHCGESPKTARVRNGARSSNPLCSCIQSAISRVMRRISRKRASARIVRTRARCGAIVVAQTILCNEPLASATILVQEDIEPRLADIMPDCHLTFSRPSGTALCRTSFARRHRQLAPAGTFRS
jgi:hypothetical protein